MLQAHIDCTEELDLASELPSDPLPHEEASKYEGDNASELVWEDNEQSCDEEGIEMANCFREGKGSRIS